MLHQMSPPKNCSTYKTNGKIGRIFPTKEQVIVIHNLSCNHDITTAVEALMMNNALANSSSIFVLVPTSDDEDDDNFGSTIGIQLSENYARRKNTHELESNMRLRRPLSCNLKSPKYKNEILELVLSTASAPKQMKISNKLCQMTTPYEVTNKLCQMTTPCAVTNKLCQITTPQADWHKRQRHARFAVKEDKKVNNKICQVTSPAGQAFNKMTYIVGTDTTIDRPCCCDIEKPADVDLDKLCCCADTNFSESDQNFTKRMIKNRSQLISPVLVKTGFSTEEFSLPKQSSISERDKRVSSISAHLIAPETENYDGSPIFDIKQRYIYNTPLSELEENQKSTLKSCQCTPEKLRLLLEQVLAEKSLKKTNVCCGSPMETSGLPKRIHFIDVKCSACMLPKQKNENIRNKLKSTRSVDCNCDEISIATNKSPTMQKIEASTLFCSDDPTSIQGLRYVAKQTPLPNRQILTGQPKHLDLSSQPMRTVGKELCSAVEARDTYIEPSKQMGNNVMIDNNTKFNHAVRGQNNRNSLIPKPLSNYGNMSVCSKTKDQIKVDLIQALSGFKYLHEQASTKPTINLDADDMRGKINLEYPPSNTLTHYDNMSISSNKKYPMKTNLTQILSGFKYPQKQPSATQKFKATFEDFIKYYANMKTNVPSEPKSSIKNSAKKALKFNENHNVITGPIVNIKDRKMKEDPQHGLNVRYGGKSSHSKAST